MLTRLSVIHYSLFIIHYPLFPASFSPSYAFAAGKTFARERRRAGALCYNRGMKDFQEISVWDFAAKPTDLIKNNWMLIAAGTREKFNAMTANWGGLGVMWNLPVAFVVIRPQRYTKEFVDVEARFSLSFPPAEFKRAMGYLGKVSGRDEDKIAASGLTPAFDAATGTPFFAEAHTVLLCRKLYAQPMTSAGFIDRAPEAQWYPDRDYHTLYVAEIEKVLVAK